MSRRTNGVAATYLRNRGVPMMEVPLDVLDIARRLTDGDELWRGDPTMELLYNDVTGHFEVWAIDPRNNPYMAWSGPYCDQRILTELAETDWQRGSKAILDRLVREAASAESKIESARADIAGEMAEKMSWALHRAFATHLGGKSSTYSFS